MKSLATYIQESKADDADYIAIELEAAGFEENKDFKFDKDVLFARDKQIAEGIADELIVKYPKLTMADKPRKSDGFIKITI